MVKNKEEFQTKAKSQRVKERGREDEKRNDNNTGSETWSITGRKKYN